MLTAQSLPLPVAPLPTPALVVDVDRLDANVVAMAAAMTSAGVVLRPHFKTSKMLEVARRQLAAGAVGVTCATPEEVDALLDASIDDVFWANGTASVGKARQAADFNRRGRVAVGVDSVELAELLRDAAAAASVTIPCLIELDTGLHRTGVPAGRAVALARAVTALPGLEMVGIYTHEGQLAGIDGDRAEVRKAGLSAGATLAAVAAEIRAAGFALPIVSVGSTPGWDSAPRAEGVTEARPGTYVFFDANQLRLESAAIEQCALTVLTTVVSTQREDGVVVDAGLKAMSSDRSNRGGTFGLVLDSAGRVDESLSFDLAYEEHGLLTGPGSGRLAVGDVLRILPNHACGVVNMWSRVYAVRDGIAIEEWNPRGRH